MARPSATGNYARAGKAVADDATYSLDVARTYSPKADEMVRHAAKLRGQENIAAIKASEKVASAGIAQSAKTKAYKTELDAEQELRGAKRKAGLLAAAGKFLGTGIGGLAPSDRKKREVGANDEYFNKRINQYRNQATEILETPLPTFESPSLTTDNTSSSSSSSTVSSDISAQHAAGPGQLSKAQINKYALDAGFTPEQAATVVGIAGGESGYDPSNSTVRSGLHAKTGEDSVGLMQINWGYHKDSGWLQGLGITKREDLFDPAKNMKAAKYLYDGRGNFGDWTVYNKGIYKDYL